MKNKMVKNLKNIDIKLFYYFRNWLFAHRVNIYILLFFLVVREVLVKTPYLNVIYANNIDTINSFAISLVVVIFTGFNGRRLLLISVGLFLPLALLTLLHREPLAELLANNIYILLCIGVLGMIIRFVRRENE